MTTQFCPHAQIFLFGSYIHGDAGDDSDVDLLIEFSKPVSFFKLYDIEEALKKSLGKDVDIGTPDSLSKYIKDDILAEAQLIYEH
ncbi:nucleotidyltransferase domain-containing protein [Patescibacteria group bacterium]|nr:nucleotidyltransferase domain-containing protein [Patescibacteria group bacterium]MBU2259249.1 nucleotidyltransferase domain-containing protein [Patescibacteria group bacterium]